MLKFLQKICFLFLFFSGGSLNAAVDPSTLLPPHEAFAPQLVHRAQGLSVQFAIAEGYYLYREKFVIDAPDEFQAAVLPAGEPHSDDFFGTQEIYRHALNIDVPYLPDAAAPAQMAVRVRYQGCADAGICYPPAEAHFTINRDGVFLPDGAKKKAAASLFSLTEPPAVSPRPDNLAARHEAFRLSRETLGKNLLAFFLAGLGLSFTACMYPLLPIVSGVVLGKKPGGKMRAFGLSFLYVQGLAATYTAVGIAAGLTGALLTVWLQQPVVILTAAAMMVVLALAMFDVFSVQMPLAVQQFFDEKSRRLPGGRALPVMLMGAFSALIVGPCMAPPLAFALGYIAQNGDAALGGLALYVLASGMGVPLIAVAVFGAHFLPKAGVWMKGIQRVFGCLILAAAVYLAAPFLPYEWVLGAYTLIMLIPAGLLLARNNRFSGSLKAFCAVFGAALLAYSLYFAYAGTENRPTALHRFLSLAPAPPPDSAHAQTFFRQPEDLEAAVRAAFRADPAAPVFVDFYADWCISCKEMAAKTFSRAEVWQAIDRSRFFTADVTDNTPAQQALLKKYRLFGPPGLFALHDENTFSEPLIGFIAAEDLIDWAQNLRAPVQISANE